MPEDDLLTHFKKYKNYDISFITLIQPRLEGIVQPLSQIPPAFYITSKATAKQISKNNLGSLYTLIMPSFRCCRRPATSNVAVVTPMAIYSYAH